jgi:hypothetical protein
MADHMITFLYKQRPDDTFVIESGGNPYHVIADDPLYEQCVEEYAELEVLPPDEPEPQEPELLTQGPFLITSQQAYKPGGGPWADASDARIKTIVGDYQAGLAEILQLQPRLFTYRGNDTLSDPQADKATVPPFKGSPHFQVATAGTQFIGLIAQEVEAVLPEMVSSTANGWIDGDPVDDLRSLDTTALAFCLVNAIKTLDARLRELEGP